MNREEEEKELLERRGRRIFIDPDEFPGPEDAEALEQYSVFGKLGFYGVQMNTTSGAAAFLKQTTAILAAGPSAIWITPEGRFSDARDHDAGLMPGLSHMCNKLKRGSVVPLALEYVFWDERLPVCLAMFGQPVQIADLACIRTASPASRG